MRKTAGKNSEAGKAIRISNLNVRQAKWWYKIVKRKRGRQELLVVEVTSGGGGEKERKFTRINQKQKGGYCARSWNDLLPPPVFQTVLDVPGRVGKGHHLWARPSPIGYCPYQSVRRMNH